MFVKISIQVFAITIMIMQVCTILILCGVLVDFGYIYQQELALAMFQLINLSIYYLARYYQAVPPKYERMLIIALIFTATTAIEHFYFADVTNNLIKAIAMLANVLIMFKFDLLFKVMTSALYRQDKLIIEKIK